VNEQTGTEEKRRVHAEVVRPSLGVQTERLLDETTPPPPPSFPRKCFGDLYDNLGMLILLNAITAVFCLPFLAVTWVAVAAAFKGGNGGVLVISAPLLLLTSLPAAGAYGALSRYTGDIVEGAPRYLSDYWQKGLPLFWRSWLGFLLQAGITLVIVLNIGFYITQSNMAFKVLGVVLLSVLLVWVLASLFVWPMIVRRYRWRSIVRNAFLLAVVAPFRCIAVLLVLLVLSAVLLAIAVGIFALLLSLWALFQNEIFVYLRDKFGGDQPAAAPAAAAS